VDDRQPNFSGPQSDPDVPTERYINKMCQLTLRVSKLLKKSSSRLQILGARKVIRRKFYTENQKSRGDPCTSLLSGVSARCMWTGTRVCVCGRKLQWLCAKY